MMTKTAVHCKVWLLNDGHDVNASNFGFCNKLFGVLAKT